MTKFLSNCDPSDCCAGTNLGNLFDFYDLAVHGAPKSATLRTSGSTDAECTVWFLLSSLEDRSIFHVFPARWSPSVASLPN